MVTKDKPWEKLADEHSAERTLCAQRRADVEPLADPATKVLELIAQGELRGQAQAVGSSSVQRVRFASVIRLIERQVDVRHAALDELTRLSQELGAYE